MIAKGSGCSVPIQSKNFRRMISELKNCLLKFMCPPSKHRPKSSDVDDGDAKEPPAKKIKVEKITGEDVAKLPNP